MKRLLIPIIVFSIPMFVLSQQVTSLDAAPADTNYWSYYNPVNEGAESGPTGHFASCTDCDTSKAYVKVSYVTDNKAEGDGAMYLQYAAHDTMTWGGYAKIQHFHPDTLNGYYNWSAYDTLSFHYYVPEPYKQEGSGGRVIHLRFNLSDYKDVETADYTSASALGEFYYSFHYILDDTSATWKRIDIPLVRNDDWAGNGFNLTGWAGVNGNGVLDTDKIKGFNFEFSIDGSGTGDHAYGQILIDNIHLRGLKPSHLVGFTGINIPGNNSSFGWGGSSLEVVDKAGADGKSNALKWVQGDEWGNGATGAGFTIKSEDMSREWMTDSLKFKMKADADSPEIKFQIEGGSGKVGHVVTPDASGEWKEYSLALKDFTYQEGTSGLDTANIKVLQFMANSITETTFNGSVGRTFMFDYMWTGNPDIDASPPAPVSTVGAVAGKYYNTVTWMDTEGESDEVYDVYTSRIAGADLTDSRVDKVSSGVLEGVQSALHRLYWPNVTHNNTDYYFVQTIDEAGNKSDVATTSDITNVAWGVPTISMSPPSTFKADGDLSEWESSDITPFVVGVSNNSWLTPKVWGTVDDDQDLTGQVYIAVDDSFLYVAADVIDDVYYGFETGNWWEHDVFEMFIGLYDQRGTKHGAMMRGASPDYKFYFTEKSIVNDFNAQASLGTNGDGNYYHEGFDSDYVVEARIKLTDIAFGDDVVWTPEEGQRIPLELAFHDNDGSGWEGNVFCSPINNDNAWQTPSVWAFTWVGEKAYTVDVKNDRQPLISEFQLSDNYPNPFNPSTRLDFTLPMVSRVKMTIYDISGREVEVLVDEIKTIGKHTVTWHAGRLPAGVYIARLEAGSFNQTKKMILVK